jgi:hypothetical protein
VWQQMPFWHAVWAARNHPEKIGSHGQSCWKKIGSAEKNRVGQEPEPQVFFFRPRALHRNIRATGSIPARGATVAFFAKSAQGSGIKVYRNLYLKIPATKLFLKFYYPSTINSIKCIMPQNLEQIKVCSTN